MNLRLCWYCFLRLTGDRASEFRRILGCFPAAADSSASFFRSISARTGGAASATTELCIVLRGPGMSFQLQSEFESRACAFNSLPAATEFCIFLPDCRCLSGFHRILCSGWPLTSLLSFIESPVAAGPQLTLRRLSHAQSSQRPVTNLRFRSDTASPVRLEMLFPIPYRLTNW